MIVVPQGAELLRRHAQTVYSEDVTWRDHFMMTATEADERLRIVLARGDELHEVMIPADCTFGEVRTLMLRALERTAA